MFRARKKRTAPDLGFVGEIVASDPRWLEAIWKMDAVPVLSSLALGFDGEYYNINADEMAAACAICCEADALVFLTDVPGVRGSDGEVMRWLSVDQIASLTRDAVISGGMLPKLSACREALLHGSSPRKDPAGRSCGCSTRSLYFARDIRNRSDGGMMTQTDKKLESIQAAEAKLLLSTYERNPILFVGGEGVHLIDEAGVKYLDLLSGIGVNALGYGHPAILNAISRQSQKLIHTSNLYFHEGQAELAMRLTEMTGLDRVFFTNSGTEAWEAAMKLARAYAGLRRSEGRPIGTKFLALENSFHGRTFGSVSTTHKAKYREPFGPVVPALSSFASTMSTI